MAQGRGELSRPSQRVSPRVFRIIALPAPTEREKSQLYFQRYIKHMPAAGEIVIFDRELVQQGGCRAGSWGFVP